MKFILGALLTIPMSLGLLVWATGLAVVDVREGGPDGTRLVVPVPLALASAVLHFVDTGRTRMRCPEFAEHREAATRLARELEHAPDGRFVEVEGRREHVTIDKIDDILVIEVHEDDNDVLVRVPVSALQELIESYDGEAFQAEDVLAALRGAPSGEWVRVRDGDDHVRVWIW
jgi:hypothetical protein